VAFGDVVAVALRWDGLPAVLGQLGDLNGKVVIDCTNRFSTPPGGSANSSVLLDRSYDHRPPNLRFLTTHYENL
jgi:predicted dinucleotide-binding enzyme